MKTTVNAANDIERVIDDLAYDFSQFDLQSFLAHIEHIEQKPILVNAVPLEPDLQGLLVRTETANYIFINANLHTIHRTHTILHEIGHLLLKHPGELTGDVLGQELIKLLATSFKTIEEIPLQVNSLFRTVEKTQKRDLDELEAENFARYVMRLSVSSGRRKQLTSESTSINQLKRLIDRFCFQD